MKEFLKKYRFEILLSIFYLLSSALITYPLVLNFNSSIYGLSEEYVLEADVPYSTPVRNADAYGTIWEFWWKKQAFLQKIPGEFCPLLGISGTTFDLGILHMPIINAAAKWLTILFNEVFAFNLLILLSFPLAGLAMYLLAFEVTKNRWASVLAGFIFAFSPLHRRYSFEWLGNAQWHWLPLYVLALLKLDETKSIRWGLLTGLLFSITLIENYYFGYFAVFFTLAFVLLRFPRDRQRLKSYLLALLTILILTLPVTSSFIGESMRLAEGLEGEIVGFVREEWPRFAFSARPWFYLLPDINHPVFGQIVKKIYAWIAQHPPYFLTQPFYPREHSLFLGWTVLILSGVAVFSALRKRLSTQPVISSEAEESSEAYNAAFDLDPSTPPRLPLGVAQDDRRRELIWLFLFLGITMMIFSAPPFATISLHKIYFPAHFLYKLFPMFRSYARFGVLVLLCVSILAALGIRVILEKLKSSRSRVLLFSLIFGLIFFEFLDFPPFHNVSLDTLPVYKWIAQQPGDFGILVYPEDASNFDLLAQRLHGKRFLNPKGLTPSEVREIYDHLADAETAEKLREWGVRFVVVRRDTSLGLEKNYTLIETFDDPRVYLFEVPQ